MEKTILISILVAGVFRAAFGLSCPEGYEHPGLHGDKCYAWAGFMYRNTWEDAKKVENGLHSRQTVSHFEPNTL